MLDLNLEFSMQGISTSVRLGTKNVIFVAWNPELMAVNKLGLA